MIKDDKIRVQVTMSRVMADKLKEMADSSGVTVSQYCAVVLGQHVSQTNKMFDMLNNAFGSSLAELIEQKGESTLK